MMLSVLSLLAGAMMGISLLGFIVAFVVVGIVPEVALVASLRSLGKGLGTRTVTEDPRRPVPLN